MLVLMASHEVKRRESEHIVITRLPAGSFGTSHPLARFFVSRDDMASLHVGNGGHCSGLRWPLQLDG